MGHAQLIIYYLINNLSLKIRIFIKDKQWRFEVIYVDQLFN